MLKHMLLTKRPQGDTRHDVTPGGAADTVPPPSPLWCVALDEVVRIELFSPIDLYTCTGDGDNRPPSIDILPEYGCHGFRRARQQRRRSGVLVQSRRASRTSSSIDCTRRASLRRRSSTDHRRGSWAGATFGLAHRVHSTSSLDLRTERKGGPLRRWSGLAQDTFDALPESVSQLNPVESGIDPVPVMRQWQRQRQRHGNGHAQHDEADGRDPLRLANRMSGTSGSTMGKRGSAGSVAAGAWAGSEEAEAAKSTDTFQAYMPFSRRTSMPAAPDSKESKPNSRLMMRRSRRTMLDGKLAACLASFSETNDASLQSSCHHRARKFSAERQRQRHQLQAATSSRQHDYAANTQL